MGCVSSDRKNPPDDRSKMLLEYLKGVEVKEVKEVKAHQNGHISSDFPDQLNEGDYFEANDFSNIKIISEDPNGINLLCLRCNIKFNKRKLQDHLNSMKHLDKL